jgi:hypothetical protein
MLEMGDMKKCSAGFWQEKKEQRMRFAVGEDIMGLYSYEVVG